MPRIDREIARLYLPPEPMGPMGPLDLLVQPHEAAEGQAAQWCLTAPQGLTRALVLELARPADWSLLGEVWRGVQTDLALPAPAIAVSGVDAFQLWFSLAEPVEAALGARVLSALCSRYLPQVRADRLCMWPGSVEASSTAGMDTACIHAVPQMRMEGQWSAFVAPDLAPVFEDTPWLDIPPNDEGQAELLSRQQSIPTRDFAQALQQLGLSASTGSAPRSGTVTPQPPINAAHTSSDARAQAQHFLMQAMHNEHLPMAQRIEAAKALLQHGAAGT
jgi:hypothetical protein